MGLELRLGAGDLVLLRVLLVRDLQRRLMCARGAVAEETGVEADMDRGALLRLESHLGRGRVGVRGRGRARVRVRVRVRGRARGRARARVRVRVRGSRLPVLAAEEDDHARDVVLGVGLERAEDDRLARLVGVITR